MFSGASSIARWVLLITAMLRVSASGLHAEPIFVVDSTDHSIGTLPVLRRGSESLVPLGTLSHLANWREEHSDSQCTVLLESAKVSLRLTNPFARIDNHFVQLRVAPELWDGSFWIPVRNVDELFAGAVRLRADARAVRLNMIRANATATRDTASNSSDRAKTPWSLATIIVDPGHGGRDPGAPGPPGWHEKVITLDIARRLAALIEKQGLAAKLTRSGDDFVSLDRRTRFANEMHGDLFLSIHCNSNHDKHAHGVEAYFLKAARTERAVEVALRENSVVKLEDAGTDYRDLTQENYILLSMAASQNMKDSETWAAQATAKAAAHCKLVSRGVDQAGFYVLMGAQMPAVLVECGYLSNAADAKMLTSEQGRQAIAEALLTSILDMKTKLETSASR